MRLAWGTGTTLLLLTLSACSGSGGSWSGLHLFGGRADADGDGYGGAKDCDDSDPSVHVGAAEYCDGVDNDCDGETDEVDAVDRGSWYADGDGDGYGRDDSVQWSCTPPAGMVAEGGDCDDEDAGVHPGADEHPCRRVDVDCDGQVPTSAATIGESAFDSIQEALDAAEPADTVQVCPGTHRERLEVREGAALALESWTGSASDTILDGEGSYTILFMDTSADVTVRNLSFENGQADDTAGGAIRALAPSLRVEGCAFRNNNAEQRGGAIAIGTGLGDSASDVALTDCTFEENSAENGGALSSNGGGVRGQVVLDIDGCTFSDNSAGHAGGALHFSGGEGPIVATIRDTSFLGNSSDYGGGAISLSPTYAEYDFELDNVVLSGNVTYGTGGAIDLTEIDGRLPGSATIRLIDSAVTSNVSTDAYPAGVSLVRSYWLYSENTDWGSDSSDNDIGDFLGIGIAYSADDWDEYFYGLGPSETFTCDDSGCWR